ncbi:phosphonate metabolism protein PhnP [Psychromonas sp.]|nr:phosphonate metabolism protein PhnP [Psychromonas sp.]
MRLTLLGTGNVQGCPVYGCKCSACLRSQQDARYSRHLCSALLEHDGKKVLLDANHPQLQQLFPAGTIDAILLTHYHMDHVQALFDLRWGVAPSIPVYQPNDPQGCDDLFKHPGLLQFQPANQANIPFQLVGVEVMPLTLQHSKTTLGYCFNSPQGSIAYLTDTQGIPAESWDYLLEKKPDFIVIDCNNSPLQRPKNHNNLQDVLTLAERLPNTCWVLTHISHELDCYLLEYPHCLRDNMVIGHDGLQINL